MILSYADTSQNILITMNGFILTTKATIVWNLIFIKIKQSSASFMNSK